MAFFSNALIKTQVGVETTKGVKVASNNQFFGLQVDCDPKVPQTEIRQAGNLFPTGTVVGKDHTEASIKGAANAQDLIYLLSTIVTPSFASNGEGVLATFFPNALSTNDYKTLSVQYGASGSGNCASFTHGALTDIELDFEPTKPVEVSAKMLGQSLEFGDTFTSTPVVLGESVLSPQTIDLYIADSIAGLSAGAVKAMSAKFKWSKIKGDVYTLTSDDSSFSEMVETAPDVSLDIQVPKGTVSDGFFSALKAGTTYYVEIIAKGALISGSTYNQVRLRMPIKFTNPGLGNTQDVWTSNYTLNGIYKDDFNTTGGCVLIEVISALTDIDT